MRDGRIGGNTLRALGAAFVCCALAGCASGELTAQSAGPAALAPPTGGANASALPTAGAESQDAGPPPPSLGTPPTMAPTAPPEPLRLEIDAPVRGARIDGDRVRVAGRVTGGVDPALVVAGEPVSLGPTGRFSVTLPVAQGLNVLVTTATSAGAQPPGAEDRRALLADADADPRAAVEFGAGARVGASAFPVISRKVSDFAESLDIEALVAGNTPEGITLEAARFSRVDVNMTPQNGYIDVDLAVRDLYVRVSAEVTFGFTFTFTGSATANPARVSAQLRASARPDGSLALDVSQEQVALDNFDYDVVGVPDFVEDWFQDRVRTLAEDTVRDALADFVVPGLFDPASLQRTVEVFGTPIHLGLKLDDVRVTRAGIDVEADATAFADGRVAHPEPAVRPIASSVVPMAGADLDVAASVDLVNRLLHAAWAGGLLDQTLDAASGVAGDAPLRVALLAAALGDAARGLPFDAPLVLTLRPLLPPVARLEKGPRPVVIETGDLLLDIGTAESGTLVTMALHFIARGTLNVEALDTISLSPDLEVEVNADVAETPRGSVDEVLLEQLVETFAGAIPGIIAEQTFAFGTDFLPFPLRLRSPRMDVDNREEWLHLLTDVE